MTPNKFTGVRYDWKGCPHASRGFLYVYKSDDDNSYVFIDRWGTIIKRFMSYHEAVCYAEKNQSLIDRNIETSELTHAVYKAVMWFLEYGTWNTSSLSIKEELTIFNAWNNCGHTEEVFSNMCFQGRIDKSLLTGFDSLLYIYNLERQMREEIQS